MTSKWTPNFVTVATETTLPGSLPIAWLLI